MVGMTDLALLQTRVDALANELKHNRDPKILLLFLHEELGEVTRALLKHVGHKEDNDRIVESYAQELGDVFFLLLSLSSATGVDLEKELRYTIDKLQKREKEKAV